MAESFRATQRFEKIVTAILEANAFEVVDVSMSDRGWDVSASLQNITYAIEIKYYRTSQPQFSLIFAAAAQLRNQVAHSHTNKKTAIRGILVLSCRLSETQRLTLEESLKIVIVDRTDLYIWARARPELVENLRLVLEDQSEPDVNRLNLVTADADGRDFGAFIERARSFPWSSTAPISPPPSTGAGLCKELSELRPGTTDWSRYERLGFRILKYLFEDALRGWHKQLRTDDGLNRFDLVCRIQSDKDFWRLLTHQLRSQYILFEFKNHSNPISQGEILTTERYLLERALRRVGIILSRFGANTNADLMIQGAMRENGKLILILDDDEICQLLHGRDAGDDPSDVLFEKVDKFLLGLPR